MLTVTQPIAPDIDRFIGYVRAAFERKRFANGGPLVGLLELRLRELISARHLLLVCNGTAALQLILRALGIRGEVITTPFTFCATTQAITWIGATPVLVDIEDNSLTINPESIEAAITPRTEAILGVHVFGQACNVDAIKAIAAKHSLAVIYDGAHAFNTARSGVPVGAFGNATAYSFHATKLFHTAEGGGIETPDAALASKLALMRNFGIAAEDQIVEVGTNAKMSELSAAMGLAVLDELAEEDNRRAKLREYYNAHLQEVPILSIHPADEQLVQIQQYYVVRVRHNSTPRVRDLLHANLKARGILSRRYFYPLTSEILGEYPCITADLPVARKISEEVLVLPFHGGLSTKDADYVIDSIKSFSDNLDS
jgi:dTDP-4-amino-4,6-dideoxygalactose transaminase